MPGDARPFGPFPLVGTVVHLSVNRQPHPRRPLVLIAAVVGVFAITAAACSEDQNDAVTTSSAAPVSTDSTVATTVPLPMGDIVGTALTSHVFTELAGLAVDEGLVDTLRGVTAVARVATVDAVGALAPSDRVVTRIAKERVRPFAAAHEVIARASVGAVIAYAAVKKVGTVTRIQGVVAFRASQNVVTCPCFEQIVAQIADERVIAQFTAQGIVVASARKRVFASAAVEQVVADAAFECVVAQFADQVVGIGATVRKIGPHVLIVTPLPSFFGVPPFEVSADELRYLAEYDAMVGDHTLFSSAEGIETAAQAAQLREMGCTYGQGFHLGTPLSAMDASALLQLRGTPR